MFPNGNRRRSHSTHRRRDILTQTHKSGREMSFETGVKTRRAVGRLNVVAAYITLSSVVYYAGAILVLHLLRTDFDPRYRYLSEYAVGPYGALMSSTFFVLSAGSLALSIGLWRSVSSKLRFLPGLLFWLAWTCAVFLAGVFTGDLQGTPHTRLGQIHEQMGMIAFPSASLAVALISVPLRWEEKWSSVWLAAILLSVVVIASFLVLDRFGQADLGGLDQRVFLAATLIWMWILGRKILTLAE
jgi:hypothetical protein